ncbi:MAG: hypothetical protein LAP40_03225 [Acidobacteriia bacterium]|nr:hypothetical protein [Terriglobia bacterium]
MKRTMIAGMLALAAGVTGLMAQKGKDKGSDAPAATAAPAATGPKVKSAEEGKAVTALVQAQGNPDKVIAAAEDLLTKYADTEFKDTALYMEAVSYQQKGDREKMQLYAERTVAANPKQFQASLMLAEATVQQTREHDLDRDEKLAKADKYANDAISAINEAAKPAPQITDQQWTEAKKDLIAEAHDALGMSALLRKNYDGAISELKLAVEGAAHPEPAFQVRLASAYQSAGKYDESIATAEKVMNDPLAAQQIKQIAQAIRAGSVVAKNKASGQGATPNAPSQVEIKKP